MWCAKCKMDTKCAAIPLERDRSDQRVQNKALAAGVGIVHFFARDRACTVCGEEFETVEVDKGVLYELVKLRDFLQEARSQAQALAGRADALTKWQE